MARECGESCVDTSDPDVKSQDRIMSHDVVKRLFRLRNEVNRRDIVFVASDTIQYKHLAHYILQNTTQVKSLHSSSLHTRRMNTLSDADTLLTEFFIMIFADEIVCMGSSSISYSAASISSKRCE